MTDKNQATETQILIVEDELILAKSLGNNLQTLGYGVPAIVASGEEGVQKAGEMQPDLVLMDIKLKGKIDGVEAAEQIRTRFDIPVVYMTGYADEETLQRAKITEPFGYILKPFEARELHSTIEMALYKHEMDQKLKEYSERLEELVEERTQELRDAHEQLVRQEKLAVLGQLAGSVSHELRGPLGVISNAAYFLNLILKEPEPTVKESLDMITQEVRVSERIIRSLLDFARTRSPIPQGVDVNDVLREALSRTAVPENVEVTTQLDESLPTIQADLDQLRQVFSNIILNAVQAMAEGGRLVIKSSEVSGKPPESGWVSVSVTDTGVGISKENLEKLFEPLFTTKAKGIGLGLALVKILVEGHGGAIEVESEEGRSSTFTIRLPISDFGIPDSSIGEEPVLSVAEVARPRRKA